jgi:hypothetical protein
MNVFKLASSYSISTVHCEEGNDSVSVCVSVLTTNLKHGTLAKNAVQTGTIPPRKAVQGFCKEMINA